MTNPAVPLDFKTGLGYSPNSGPPVGGWSYQPVSTFFGDNLNQLLPSGRTYFGGKRRRRRFSNNPKKKRFGNPAYPLSNQPNPSIDMKTFPLPPIGPGLTPGGDGGVWLQGMPNFDSYWAYGKSKKRSSKRKFKRSKRSGKRSGKRSKRSGKRSKRSRRRRVRSKRS